MRVYCPSRRRDVGASGRARSSLILRNVPRNGDTSAHAFELTLQVVTFLSGLLFGGGQVRIRIPVLAASRRMVRSVDSGTGSGTTGALLALSFSEDHASGGRRAALVFSPPSEGRLRRSSFTLVFMNSSSIGPRLHVARRSMKLQGRLFIRFCRRGSPAFRCSDDTVGRPPKLFRSAHSHAHSSSSRRNRTEYSRSAQVRGPRILLDGIGDRATSAWLYNFGKGGLSLNRHRDGNKQMAISGGVSGSDGAGVPGRRARCLG